MMAIHANDIKGRGHRWPVCDDSALTIQGSVTGCKGMGVAVMIIEIDVKEVSGVMVTYNPVCSVHVTRVQL